MRAVRARSTTAHAVIAAALTRIADVDPRLVAFTAVFAERALLRANRIDAEIAAGRDPGPLPGVPFAAKNLFDVAGIITRAGAAVTAPIRRPSAMQLRWPRSKSAVPCSSA